MPRRVLVALAALSLSLAAGIALFARQSQVHREGAKQVDVQGQASWTCPMHPQVHQHRPGNCPICGMPLVKKVAPGSIEPPLSAVDGDASLAQASSAPGHSIAIDARMVQNLGMRTAPVERAGRRPSNDGSTADSPSVPTEAVIRTGTRTVLIVADGDGRFHPVEVRLGPEVGNRTIITQGVEEGQRVVVSGQFLIDSEASLRGAYHRMGAP